MHTWPADRSESARCVGPASAGGGSSLQACDLVGSAMLFAYVDRQTIYWAASTLFVLLLAYCLRPGQAVPRFPPQWSGELRPLCPGLGRWKLDMPLTSFETSGSGIATKSDLGENLTCTDPGTGQKLGQTVAATPDQASPAGFMAQLVSVTFVVLNSSRSMSMNDDTSSSGLVVRVQVRQQIGLAKAASKVRSQLIFSCSLTH